MTAYRFGTDWRISRNARESTLKQFLQIHTGGELLGEKKANPLPESSFQLHQFGTYYLRSYLICFISPQKSPQVMCSYRFLKLTKSKETGKRIPFYLKKYSTVIF
jgi:hypothetical protein